MNPLAVYQQNACAGWTRIDLLLALFNGAIERAEKALKALVQGEQEEESRLRARTRMIVAGLAASVDPGGELAGNFLALYQFAMQKLAEGGADNIRAVVRVLGTLKEGFEQVRPQAVELERSGQVPPAVARSVLRLLA